MTLQPLLTKAAGTTTAVVRGIDPDQLDAATPCAEFAVRDLVNHLAWSLPMLTSMARKEEPPSGEPGDITTGPWADLITGRIDDLVHAWANPEAWEGTTPGMGLPAAVAGSMSLSELVIHGWDLARATGQPYPCDDEVSEAALGFFAEMGDTGRNMGAFGDEVAVPSSAPALDRVMGQSGRDPAWSA